MDVSYEKHADRNVMIIKNIGDSENDYKSKMILNNKIEGIVPMTLEYVNNEKEIHYDITSKTAIKDMFAVHLASAKNLTWQISYLNGVFNFRYRIYFL